MTTEQWKKVFSKRVLQRLIDLEMTQKQLADAVGIHEVTLCHYLSERNIPKADVVVSMAKVLKCSVADLIEVGEMITD